VLALPAAVSRAVDAIKDFLEKKKEEMSKKSGYREGGEAEK
jgi:hypothetical protein